MGDAQTPMSQQPTANDLIKFQITRRLVHLSKTFLEMLEKLLQARKINQEDFFKMRKTILDKNGDAQRELTDFIDKFHINLSGGGNDTL
jgi:Mn-containing catalase